MTVVACSTSARLGTAHPVRAAGCRWVAAPRLSRAARLQTRAQQQASSEPSPWDTLSVDELQEWEVRCRAAGPARAATAAFWGWARPPPLTWRGPAAAPLPAAPGSPSCSPCLLLCRSPAAPPPLRPTGGSPLSPVRRLHHAQHCAAGDGAAHAPARHHQLPRAPQEPGHQRPEEAVQGAARGCAPPAEQQRRRAGAGRTRARGRRGARRATPCSRRLRSPPPQPQPSPPPPPPSAPARRPHPHGCQDGRAPGLVAGRGGADPGAALCVQHARGQVHLGRGPPGLHPQDADGAPLPHAHHPQAGRPVGCARRGGRAGRA